MVDVHSAKRYGREDRFWITGFSLARHYVYRSRWTRDILKVNVVKLNAQRRKNH